MPGSAYYKKNKRKCKAASQEWRRKHPKPHRAYLKRYRKDNADKLRKQNREYREARAKRIRGGVATDVDERQWAHAVLTRIARRTSHKLTVEQIVTLWKLQKGRCALSGLKLKRMAGGHDPLCASLDRINPRKGYTVYNVRFLAWCVNSFRGQMTDTQMLKIAKALVGA